MGDAEGARTGVGELVSSVAVADDQATSEGAEVEREVVQLTPALGVGGVVELKAPVEPVAVHQVGADPAADLVCRLEKADVETGRVEGAGCDESGQPSTDDHNGAALGSHRDQATAWLALVRCATRGVGLWIANRNGRARAMLHP